MPAPVKTAPAKAAILRSPFLWVGVLLLLAIVGALVSSDSVAELARFSAEYQRRIQQTLSGSLRDIKAGSGSLALWTLATVCFGYGIVHTLGPGHGKAVVVAYFLDSTRPRAWIEGIFAGAWIAFTHTLAALLLAAALKLFATVGLLGALREVRNVEMVSYLLILAIGIWRLWAGITGRLHEHHQLVETTLRLDGRPAPVGHGNGPYRRRLRPAAVRGVRRCRSTPIRSRWPAASRS